jgi:hypothetical protein
MLAKQDATGFSGPHSLAQGELLGVNLGVAGAPEPLPVQRSGVRERDHR